MSARSSEGSFGPAKLILMTRVPWPTAQLMPLRMLNVVLSGVATLVEKACTARMPRGRRGAEQTLARGNGAGHAGAVRVRLVRRAHRVVALCHRALEIRVGGVDLGVDHRNRHVGASDHAVHVAEAELLQDVLRRVAGLTLAAR